MFLFFSIFSNVCSYLSYHRHFKSISFLLLSGFEFIETGHSSWRKSSPAKMWRPGQNKNKSCQYRYFFPARNSTRVFWLCGFPRIYCIHWGIWQSIKHWRENSLGYRENSNHTSWCWWLSSSRAGFPLKIHSNCSCWPS